MLAVRFFWMLAMPNYRRALTPGGTWFFTVNLLERRGNDLLVRHIDLLRASVAAERSRRPFAIRAWVVLPEHMHWMWTLPVGDAGFQRAGGASGRVKRLLRQAYGEPVRCRLWSAWDRISEAFSNCP